MTPSSKRVVLVPYDPAWPEAFLREREELLSLLGSATRAIHHIGSTSVPGLCAKPVLDILVESGDLAAIDAAAAVLEGRGYEARGEYGIPGRRYFVRPSEPGAGLSRPEVGQTGSGLQTAKQGAKPPEPGMKVHLHCFEAGDPRVDLHRRFRDHLRANDQAAVRYAALKKRLAEQHAGDREAYQAAKAEFIENALGRAMD